jgi:uncharacterized SAM-binding protein YcdF (DUF218 family)
MTVTMRALAIGCLAALFILGSLLGLAVWSLAPRDDPVASPDVIVVLGGAGPERAALGIELSERLDVPLVLSSSAQDFATDRGVSCPPAICIVTDPETTAGEARGVARLADSYGWQQVLVVTTEFHTARARLLFRQCLDDRVAVVGAAREGEEGPRPARWLRELLGLVAGKTVFRAC